MAGSSKATAQLIHRNDHQNSQKEMTRYNLSEKERSDDALFFASTKASTAKSNLEGITKSAKKMMMMMMMMMMIMMIIMIF